jgi:hypothetical protein
LTGQPAGPRRVSYNCWILSAPADWAGQMPALAALGSTSGPLVRRMGAVGW